MRIGKVVSFCSRFNDYEVEVIRKILCSFDAQSEQSNGIVKDIAVISFYAGQIRKLETMINTLKKRWQIGAFKS